MELSEYIFYAFLGLTGLSAVFIMLTKNILYAAFALIATFIGVAGLYIFLGAELIAATQILVYVGGILILLVFGIMLTNRLGGQKVVSLTYRKILGLVIASAFFVILFKGIMVANFGGMRWMNRSGEKAGIADFGLTLMTDYVLAFELIGILLLLALIGAVRISARAGKEVEHDR